ncbi:hypothetical protein NDU88_000575 [Pleurodeles waltl]|uniref:Secreted protein n=1 Tax=Pleurodeles waltl TaxID=8319 RepID=A0AAV7VTW6_PLEWA|nr:hypothetical protein NDU88_000563 [Pleurodeles waltl]KAJ1205140.1 hypothetical protein NDU88_000575 [Pleurodeles waltl]
MGAAWGPRVVACKVVICCWTGPVSGAAITLVGFVAVPPAPVERTLSVLESGGSSHKSPDLLGIYLGAPVGPELGWGRKPWVEEPPNKHPGLCFVR